YREHRFMWVGLVVVSTAVLVVTAPLLDTGGGPVEQAQQAELLVAAAAVLVWAYGVVCGAMTLAGEVEEATMPFLDLLPRSRSLLWRTKVLAAAVLVLADAAVLAGALALLNRGSDVTAGLSVFGLLAAFGLAGLGWALLFAANSSTVLVSLGLALAAQCVLA